MWGGPTKLEQKRFKAGAGSQHDSDPSVNEPSICYLSTRLNLHAQNFGHQQTMKGRWKPSCPLFLPCTLSFQLGRGKKKQSLKSSKTACFVRRTEATKIYQAGASTTTSPGNRPYEFHTHVLRNLSLIPSKAVPRL